MGQEASKLRERLQREGTWGRYFKPEYSVLDIGAGDDPIVPWAIVYDKKDDAKNTLNFDYDAQYLYNIPDASYDVVFAAHCFEHMREPIEALHHWWRVVKPGGYLIFEVPDEDLYEQGVWPSAFNPDHKYSYTISKEVSWCPVTKNLTQLIDTLPQRKVISIRTVDDGYDYSVTQVTDQTNLGASAGIEVIIQKHTTQREFITLLKRLTLCPFCGRGELIIRGLTQKNEYDVQCGACGLSATVTMPPND